MKVWTQEEYDAVRTDMNGAYNLGSGNFKGIDFRGRHKVVIGPQSMLGDDVRLGVGCEIGERSDIGDRFSDGGNLKVGKHCHFGEDAHIEENAIVDRGTCFATGVQICKNVDLGEEVELPRVCGYLFDSRARGADGKSLIRMSPVAGRTICAFTAEYESGRYALVAMRGVITTLDEFVSSAQHLLDITMKTEHSSRRISDAQELYQAGMFLKAIFAKRAAIA